MKIGEFVAARLTRLLPFNSAQVADQFAGPERGRMIGTEHALLIGQQRLEKPQRLARLAALSRPDSDVIAGRERGRMIGTEHARSIGQQRLEKPQRLARLAALSRPGSDVA